MSHQYLKDRLASYLKRNPTVWIPSGHIQGQVAEKADYTPQNVGRRPLRELEVHRIVEVKYVKGHAHYRYLSQEAGRNSISAS